MQWTHFKSLGEFLHSWVYKENTRLFSCYRLSCPYLQMYVNSSEKIFMNNEALSCPFQVDIVIEYLNFLPEYFSELSLWHSVSVDDDASRFHARVPVNSNNYHSPPLFCPLEECNESLAHCVQQVDNRLSALPLHLHIRPVGLGQQVDVRHDLQRNNSLGGMCFEYLLLNIMIHICVFLFC